MDWSELTNINFNLYLEKNDLETNFVADGMPTGLTSAPHCSSAGWAQPFTWLVDFSTCGQCVHPSVDEKKGESSAFIGRDMESQKQSKAVGTNITKNGKHLNTKI